ncbi:MAG: hypothetical protein ACREGC_00315, partial [Minisyncoccia bacterium]
VENCSHINTLFAKISLGNEVPKRLIEAERASANEKGKHPKVLVFDQNLTEKETEDSADNCGKGVQKPKIEHRVPH